MFILKNKTVDKTQILTWLYLLFFIIYSNAIFKQFWYLKLLLLVGICLSFFVEFFKKQVVVLLIGIVSLQMLITFYFKYYLDGNHCFVVIFVGLMLILANIFKEQGDTIIKKNAFWMLIIIMFFGAFQKLHSPTYMSGDFMNYLFANGGLFNISGVYSPLKNYYYANQEIIASFAFAKPVADGFIRVPYLFENQKNIIFYFSWFVIILELLFVAVLLIKNEKMKHLFFIIFLFSLLLTRNETGFLSLVSLLCFAQLPQKENKFFHLFYLAFFFICILLIHLGKGFF
jgi:hypothetical protein